MFNCTPLPEQKLNQRRVVVSLIPHNIKILQRCVCCNNLIETWWDSSCRLKGKYMSFDCTYSNLFETMVADPKSILCNVCFGNGEWKRRGMQIDFKRGIL